MKIVRSVFTLTDFIAYFKFRMTFECKKQSLTLLVFNLVDCLAAILLWNINYFVGSLCLFGIFLLSMALWCWYNVRQFELLLPEFKTKLDRVPFEIDFTHSGIQVRKGDMINTYIWRKIPKVRETPWFLFLYLGDFFPLIIDKRKIIDAETQSKPLYIARELRENCPDYRYIKPDDITFVSKKYLRLADIPGRAAR